MIEAPLKHAPGEVHATAAAALVSGEVIRTASGQVGVVAGLNDVASGLAVTYQTDGVRTVKKNTSTAFTVGQAVFWDVSANEAVAASLDATDALYIGVCQVAAASSATTVEVGWNVPRWGVQRANVAASAAITASSTPTLFDKAVTLPANELKVGDVVRIRAQGIATATNSTDTLAVKAFVGATEVAAVTAVDVANSDVFIIDIDVVIRTIGASGTCVAAGWGSIGANAVATAKAQFKASAAIDTTAALAVGIQATWSTTDAGNSCRLDVLNVQVIRPQ